MVEFTDEYLFGFGRMSLFLLSALAFGNVEHGSDPSGDRAAHIFFRRIDDM